MCVDETVASDYMPLLDPWGKMLNHIMLQWHHLEMMERKPIRLLSKCAKYCFGQGGCAYEFVRGEML